MPTKGGHWSDAQREKYNRTIRERESQVYETDEDVYWTFDYDLRDEYDS
jgi:hypothetical protein